MAVPPSDLAPSGCWVAVPVPGEQAGAGGGSGPLTLRCWWEQPTDRPARAGVLVLPEVFGINGWVRRVAARLAAAGYAALAVPLFPRTAPELELGYHPEALEEGRHHKLLTRSDELLTDLAAAIAWLTPRSGGGPVGCVGFCFGGHVAMLAATLPGVAATCDVYGAGVVSGRPGGGAPTLEELPTIQGRLLCLCGTEDDLIPPADVAAITVALGAINPIRQEAGLSPHQLLSLPGGHGFLCEERVAFHPESAAIAWEEILSLFAETLG